MAPRMPCTDPLTDIVSLLCQHFDPQPSELYTRCCFQHWDQLPGESIATFLAALKKLATQCNFGALTSAPEQSQSDEAQSSSTTSPGTMLPLDVMLNDQFVCRLQDRNVWQRLLAEKDLAFQKVLDIALRVDNDNDHQQCILSLGIQNQQSHCQVIC